MELQEAILKEGEKFPKRKEIAIFRNSLETTFGNSERRNLRTNPVRADPEIRKKQDYSEMRDNDKSKSEIWDRQGATGKPTISTKRNAKKRTRRFFFPA